MSNFGKSLKAEREKKGLTLDQISQGTNIGEKQLQALENGDYKILPGDFYVKQYIKSYLRVLEIDVDDFLKANPIALDESELSSSEATRDLVPKIRYSRFKRRAAFLPLLFLLFLVVLGAGYLYLNNRDLLKNVFTFSKPIDIPATGLDASAYLPRYDLDFSPVSIDLLFLEDCWLQARWSDGRMVEKVFKPGEHFLAAGYEIGLKIGNPGGVKLVLNGHEVTYLKKLSRMERINLNPSNVKEIIQK